MQGFYSVQGYVFGRPSMWEGPAMNADDAARRFLRHHNPGKGLQELRVTGKRGFPITVRIHWSSRK